MTTIIEKTRNVLNDNLTTTGRDVFTYYSSKIFTITESNISSATLVVYKNGVVWANTNYSYSSVSGKLTVTGTLTSGNSLECLYSYYNKYSDSELQGYIKAAVSYLSVYKYKTFNVKSDNIVFPTPTELEENLLAIVASIIVGGDIRSYRTPEFTITFNETESKEKRIKKTISQFKKSFGVISYIAYDTKIVNVPEVDEL